MIDHGVDEASLAAARLQETDQNSSASANEAARVSGSESTDDLDALLAQYETQTAKPGADDPNWISDEELSHRIERARLSAAQQTFQSEVQTYAHQRATEKHEADLKSLVQKVRGEVDPKLFGDSMVQAWIDARAMKDANLQQAWNNRE